MKPNNKDGYDDGEIVRQARDILGARLTAYIAGVQETRMVRAWADGTASPSHGVAQRLRLAHRIAVEIAQHEGNEVTQAWFMGMNPLLDDMSPAQTIRESHPGTVQSTIASAAQSFISWAQNHRQAQTSEVFSSSTRDNLPPSPLSDAPTTTPRVRSAIQNRSWKSSDR